MASRTVTATTIEEEVQKFADEEVARDVRDALDEMHKESIGVWGAVPTFIYWIRTKVGSLQWTGHRLQLFADHCNTCQKLY